MYKRIDFTSLGGNPVDQQSLDLMQQSYSDTLAAIAALIGNKVIISGVTVNGNNVSDGWIVYNGEIIKFTGGSLTNGVVIQETATYSPVFEDGTAHNVEFTKTAFCGVPAAFNFNELVRLDSLISLGFPKGGIVMWSGTVATIPSGWALCNGQNGTPNLTDKFIVAAGNAYGVGDTGGKAQHTLTVNEMPSHSHQVKRDGTQGGGSGSANWHIRDWSNPASDMLLNTSPTGSGQPHENRPPYYALAFIMKL